MAKYIELEPFRQPPKGNGTAHQVPTDSEARTVIDYEIRPLEQPTNGNGTAHQVPRDPEARTVVVVGEVLPPDINGLFRGLPARMQTIFNIMVGFSQPKSESEAPDEEPPRVKSARRVFLHYINLTGNHRAWLDNIRTMDPVLLPDEKKLAIFRDFADISEEMAAPKSVTPEEKGQGLLPTISTLLYANGALSRENQGLRLLLDRARTRRLQSPPSKIIP